MKHIHASLNNSQFPVVIWNPTRILKWKDFKKKPNLRSKPSASSAIGFQSEPIIDHIEIGKKYKFKITDMQLHAIFIPDFSWVMISSNDKSSSFLLKHEQGHFDLVEEIVRKTRMNTTDRFKNRCFFIKGKNKSNAKKNAILQVTKIRKKIENKLQKELQMEGTKYDTKTNHGLIKKYQEKYNQRFKKLRG